MPQNESQQMSLSGAPEGWRQILIVKKPAPVYTDEAREKGLGGTVVLRATFEASGRVSNIRVKKRLPCGLTRSAMAAARQIKFEPGMKGGVPVSKEVTLEYTFRP